MGLIPIHLYTDIPWVPYADLFGDKNGIGYTTTVEELEALVDRLQNHTAEEIHSHEERIVSLHYSHFTPAGVMQQIQRFLLGSPNDLRCLKLPSSVRDK